MANVKISALPSYTGSAADLRWFVMNNSGNTVTFKFSGYTSPYRFGNTTNSILNVYSSSSDIAGDYDNIMGGSGNTITNTGGFNNILSSEDSTIGGTAAKWNTIIGGQENEISSTNASGQNYIIGGYSNQIINDTWYATMLNVYNGYISNSYWSTIIGGDGNYISANGFYGGYSAILGGSGNYIQHAGTGGGSASAIIGCQNSYVQNAGNGIVIGAVSSYISGGIRNFIQSSNSSMVNDVNYGAIIGGHNHGMNGGNESGIFAGYSNTMTNAQDSAILGGRGNSIDMNNACCGGNVIMGGLDNYINNNPGIHSAIIAGTTNVIRDSSPKSAIIASETSVVSAKTQAVMVGTSGRTALYDYTVHFDNTHNYKTESFNVIAAGNVGGSINVDCSLGTIYTFTMTANTTPNFINLRDGQRFTFIVNNSGTFTVPTATVGGVSSTVYAKGGTLNPTNNGYTKYTAIYASGILWLNEELNFQAV